MRKQYQVQTTLVWDAATLEGAKQRVEERGFGLCLDIEAATKVLIAVAGRENCLEARIVPVDPKGEGEGENA